MTFIIWSESIFENVFPKPQKRQWPRQRIRSDNNNKNINTNSPTSENFLTKFLVREANNKRYKVRRVGRVTFQGPQTEHENLSQFNDKLLSEQQNWAELKQFQSR